VPQHKDFKRLVRARMAETGENYTRARTALASETRLDPLPDGWHMTGSRPADYEGGLLPPTCVYHGKRAIRLRLRAAQAQGGFGTIMQSIDAARYRSRRVRFSAMIRGQEIGGWAGIWLRVDRADHTRVLDNMEDRPLRGTTAWTEAANVLDVHRQQPGPGASRLALACLAPACLAHRRGQVGEASSGDRGQQVRVRREVPPRRPVGHPGPAGDLPQRHRRGAPARYNPHRRLGRQSNHLSLTDRGVSPGHSPAQSATRPWTRRRVGAWSTSGCGDARAAVALSAAR
jgi:hypothetical protein